MIPDKEVVPPPLAVRFLIPVKLTPIVVRPLKVKVKLLPAPVTPKVKIGVVPVRVVSAVRVTASL